LPAKALAENRPITLPGYTACSLIFWSSARPRRIQHLLRHAWSRGLPRRQQACTSAGPDERCRSLSQAKLMSSATGCVLRPCANHSGMISACHYFCITIAGIELCAKLKMKSVHTWAPRWNPATVCTNRTRLGSGVIKPMQSRLASHDGSPLSQFECHMSFDKDNTGPSCCQQH
jgi:hypothetical protein